MSPTIALSNYSINLIQIILFMSQLKMIKGRLKACKSLLLKRSNRNVNYAAIQDDAVSLNHARYVHDIIS